MPDQTATLHTLTPSADEPAGDGALSIEIEAPPDDALTVREEAEQRIAGAAHDQYDADEGTWLPVTAEMTAREEQMRQAWSLSKLMQAVVVREVYDQKLYLAAGFETKKAYCDQVLDLDMRTASRYYKMASRFGDFLPKLPKQALLGDGSPDRTTLSDSDSDGQDDETAEIVQGLGLSKLYQLMRVEDDELDVILKGETVTTASGREVNLRELRDASAREAGQMVRDLKDEFRGRIQRDQERAALAEAERDVLQERIAELEGDIERARAVEREYGPLQMWTEGQMDALDRAEEPFRELVNWLDRVHTVEHGEPVPDVLRREVGTMCQRLMALAVDFDTRMKPVTEQL